MNITPISNPAQRPWRVLCEALLFCEVGAAVHRSRVPRSSLKFLSRESAALLLSVWRSRDPRGHVRWASVCPHPALNSWGNWGSNLTMTLPREIEKAWWQIRSYDSSEEGILDASKPRSHASFFTSQLCVFGQVLSVSVPASLECYEDQMNLFI